MRNGKVEAINKYMYFKIKIKTWIKIRNQLITFNFIISIYDFRTDVISLQIRDS